MSSEKKENYVGQRLFFFVLQVVYVLKKLVEVGLGHNLFELCFTRPIKNCYGGFLSFSEGFWFFGLLRS